MHDAVVLKSRQKKLRLDELGLSLLRGLHVCFVSFECLTQAKRSTRLQLKLEAPSTSRSSCRRCFSSLSSACSTCPHLLSQRNTPLLQILHQSKQKRVCVG